MLLWTMVLVMVTAMTASVPIASAQGAPTLTFDGSAGPLSVPINTSLPILATGLTPMGTFTYAAYTGGDCGLRLAAAQDLQANAEGVWDWSSLSYSAPVTLWIRVTDGPNNSNCVQITWGESSPTEVPSTEEPTEIPTEIPLTEVPTEFPPAEDPSVVPTEEPTENPAGSPTSTPTETPAGSPTTTPTETPAGSPTTTPDPTGTGTATAPATTAPTDPPTATATAPVSALPTTGNDGGQSSSTTGFVLLIAGSLLMLGAATVSRRRGTTTR